MIDFQVAAVFVGLALLVGFCVGCILGWHQGYAEGIESERKFFQRRSYIATRERK
jgi:hypothetical protein